MTDDQIKAECEREFQRTGAKVVLFNPKLGTCASGSMSGKREAELAWTGIQVWQRRKVFGANRYHWIRLQTAWEKREAMRPPTDTEMLEWMCVDGRYVSHDRDGEYCNVWHNNPIREAAQRSVPVEGFPQKAYRTPREAIIAAMKVQA